MYKIQVEKLVDSRALKYSAVKKMIINSTKLVLIDLIYGLGCIKITEKPHENIKVKPASKQIELMLECYTMTPEEHEKAIKIIKEIRNALPKKHKLLAYELFEILTQEPDSNE